MKDFKILKFLDKVSPAFKSFGIDYPMMRRILQVKLVMDQRRVPTIMMNSKNSESKSSFRSSMLLYAFLGLFIGVFIFLPLPLFLKMNFIIGMLLFMIMTTMISDFSSVLLDVADKNILLPRPVQAKALNAAKLIHIVIYLFRITISIAGGSLLFGLIRYGFVFFLLFLFEIVLICGLVILVTSLFYFAILTFFSGEKLKDIINYFQIALTIFMTVMYQLIGRIFNVSNQSMIFTPHWWQFLLPSTWFAAPFSLLVEHDFSGYFILMSIVGIVVPVITMTLYSKVVAPRFEKSLQKLNNSGGSNRNTIKKKSLQRAVSNMICFPPLEKVFFRFTVRMLANERKLKLKLYPSFALSAIIPIIFLMSFSSRTQSFSETYAQITHGAYYLFIYSSVAILCPSFLLISASENYKGAWIYKALPVGNPVVVLKGAFKGFLYKYIVPIYLFLSFTVIVIYGLKTVPDLALMFINMLVLMLIIFSSSKKELPFYKDLQYTQQNNNTGVVFLSMGLCCLFAFVHYMLLKYVPFGVAINIAVSLVIAILLWRSAFKISWKDIEEDSY